MNKSIRCIRKGAIFSFQSSPIHRRILKWNFTFFLLSKIDEQKTRCKFKVRQFSLIPALHISKGSYDVNLLLPSHSILVHRMFAKCRFNHNIKFKKCWIQFDSIQIWMHIRISKNCVSFVKNPKLIQCLECPKRDGDTGLRHNAYIP